MTPTAHTSLTAAAGQVSASVSAVSIAVLGFGPAVPAGFTSMAAVLALGGPLAALATATTGGTAGGGPGVPATPAPATPAGPAAPAGAGGGPAGPDGHLVPSPSAATLVMVLIIPAGLLLALARRQAALPAAPARRGPHRPG
ncbi:MAG TPA: hypothetical protein VIZ20_01855 [Streptosporangiaceae bacterium]